MAEGLGLAANIAGLVSLADSVFRLIYKYVKEAKNAKEVAQELADEMQSTAGILHRLSLLASGLQDGDRLYNPSFKLQHVTSCQQTIARIEKPLLKAKADFESGNTLVAVRRRLKWPFSVPETRDLILELSRHKETIVLALSADSMGALLQSLSRMGGLRAAMDDTKAIVRKHMNITTRIDLRANFLKVLDFFLRYNPQPYFARALRLRHPLTGLWLLDGGPFIRWMETRNSKLWLSGIPGAGKTVLAGAMIDAAIQRDSESTAVAFFFCDYSEPKSHDPVNILCTIASQIARQDKNAFEKLNNYYKELNRDDTLAATPTVSRLTNLLLDMFDDFEHVLVVIDGLDECGEGMVDVAAVLCSLATRQRSSLSLALFSRYEQQVRNILEDEFEHVKIQAHPEDLALFTAAEIEKRISLKQLRLKNLALKDEIIQELVQGADGMFRWVSCQIDYLCELPNDTLRRSALKSLPPTLHGTYERILERVSGVNKYTRDLVQKALLWIAFADPPLTINEMCQALSVPLRDESLDDASEIDEPELALRCSSLIRKSNDERRFEFAHFTVKQFLQQLDPSDSKYGAFHLSESRAAYLMAMSELRFLTLTDFSRLPTEQRSELSFISKRNVEHPFYEYASMSWHRAATDHWDDPELISLAMKLFDPGKVPVFVSWSVEFCRHYQTGSWSSWCMTRDRESAFDLSDDLDVGRNPELGGPFQHPNRREDGPKDGISLDHEPSGSDFIVYDYAETTHDLDESGQDSEGTSATESSSAESQHPSDNSDGSGSRSPPTRAQTFSSGSRYFQEPSTTTSRSRNHAQYQSPSIYHLMELIYYIRRNDFMPLHMASLLGLLKICERLVNRDQNVNLASMFGTPLHFALLGPAIIAEIDFIDDREASWGRENIKPSDDVVALLINSGSSCTGSLRTRFHNYSIASWSLILLDLTGNRQTLSHVLLTIPPLDGALQTFRSLCRWWAEPPGSIGQNRSKMKKVLDTLSAAAETSGGELLRYLDLFEDVARQTFPSTSSDMQLIRSPGHTLDELREMIEKCIRYNDEQNLQRLIQVAEATVNFAGWKSGDIESLLGLAVSHRSVAILSYLLRKFQERSRTDISVIVLFLRCTGEGMEDLMSCLLENGLRTDAQNDNGDTIWHIAVQEKRDSVQKLEYLFTNCPSSDFINAMQVTNRKGRTALADALRHNNYKAASAIASHCHSVVGVLKCNSPPLGSLVADIKSVKLLRELGAAGLLPQMDDLDGDTPLHYLSEDTNFDVIEALLSLYSYQRGKDDKTPLEVYLSHKLYDRDSLGVAKRLMKEEVESFSAQSTHRTWQYLSAKLLGSLGSVEVDVVFDLASEFIEMGGLLSYETQYQISGLYELRVAFHEKNLIEISASRSLRYKTKMAELLIRVLEKTSFPQYLEKDDEAIQILLWSVVVNQPALIVLLLQRGVDIHKKVNGLSTLEFCCLHASNINPEAFSELLGGLDVSKIDDLDHSPEGLGLVHILGQPRVPNPPKPPSQVRVQRDGPLPRKAAAGPLPPGPPPPPPQSPSRGVTRTEALSRRLELLRQLLEKGADPNLATRASRMKPLAWHLARGWVENAKLLLKYGADCGPESADKTGWGPVAIACSRGSVGDVGFLEEVLSQTDIDVELFFRIKTDTSIVIYNKIRRHVLGASLLHIAAIWGRAKMIEFLLDHSLMPDIDIKAFDDLTPLHVATIANQNNVVKLLASRGANINAISRGRNTPLHFAISPDRHDVLRTLLELGPIHLADSNNNTPLDLAFKSKSPELVKLIQDSFEFQGVVSSGQFHRSAAALSGALESFIEADDVEGCKRLFDQGCPRDIAMRSCHECSPLLHALYRGRFTIGMWLANNNADLLGTLCGKHSNRLAERLVDYDDSDEYSGEDSDEDSGYNDDDPNDCFSNWTLLDVLITDKELGEENLSKWLSMIPDQQLRWLLENSIATHLAIVCGNCEGLQLLLTHCHNRPSLTFDKTLIQGLVNKFASVDKKAPKSPLHRAAACIDCTKILLEHGADVTISDMSGRQPLHGAVRKRDVAVVNYLLDAGAPIDARDTASNQTPLGHAVTNNLPEMVQLLIKRGADWRVKTQLGSLLWSACSALVLGQLLDLGLDPSDCESSLFPMWIISRNDFDKMSPTLDASFFQLVSLAAKVDPPARIIFWRFLEYTETLGHGRYFTLLCRRMGTGLLHPLFEGQGEDKFSALSYVLRTNPIVTLRELLRLGCNIEYEDQYNKTALMVAASEGRMEAVKFLVRSGARIQYKIGDAWTSAVIEAQKYPPIIDWLLKERFQEQQKLDMGTERQSGSTSSDKDDVRPWSGFQTKRFLLAGRYKRRWKESMLEYAIRLHRIRREQWGKVIVTLSEEREEVWCNDKPETADE